MVLGTTAFMIVFVSLIALLGLGMWLRLHFTNNNRP